MGDADGKNFCDINNSVTRQEQIRFLQDDIKSLENELMRKRKALALLKRMESNAYSEELSTDEVSRYSRQMIMPMFGSKGQIGLKRSRVLIVGAGGLGCPCGLYLAAAGVGEIFLVDNDRVELSNIHRQVLHTEHDAGAAKVDSAYAKLFSLNSNIKIVPLQLRLNSVNVAELFEAYKFDAVVDASDNVPTRYLLNDACVVSKVPLISGSAVQIEGQLTVYNFKDGPCYRCVFPKPSAPDTVASCGDNGVLGPVPGVIGVLQALETIKILTGQEEVLSGRLLTFDGADCSFKCFKLRKRADSCKMCSASPLGWDSLKRFDYQEYAGYQKVIHNLQPHEEIDVESLFCDGGEKFIVDVRQRTEFDMCRLPSTVNFPYDDIRERTNLPALKSLINLAGQEKVYMLCRRGNDSRRSIMLMKDIFKDDLKVSLVNVRGGLHEYARKVDPTFPIY